MTNRIARTCALSGVLALAFAGALTPAANAATVVPTLDADLTPVTLLGTNDFHGHFTKDFACTVASAEQEFPGSAFISAGDNVGGSPFESASQDDNPSIDYLNALKLQVSSVGNHEFDKGFDDLTGHVQSRAQWTYLGANVYEKGTTTPALPEYKVLDVNGVKVAVVGAVTTDTKNMVGADGIASIDFGDPVAAVNRVAAKLKDGDPSNGEADVVVAEYHEGAPEGGSATLEQMESASPVFKNIVTKTSANVSAIFTGHTHQLYDWDAPMPDGDGTRPIIQTDFYAHNLGILNLGYDKASGKVKQYSVVNRKVTAPTDACASLPAYTAAASIVDSANARAAQIGQQVIAQATGPITSALKPDIADRRPGTPAQALDLAAQVLRAGRPQDTHQALPRGRHQQRHLAPTLVRAVQPLHPHVGDVPRPAAQRRHPRGGARVGHVHVHPPVSARPGHDHGVAEVGQAPSQPLDQPVGAAGGGLAEGQAQDHLEGGVGGRGGVGVTGALRVTLPVVGRGVVRRGRELGRRPLAETEELVRATGLGSGADGRARTGGTAAGRAPRGRRTSSAGRSRRRT